MSGWRSMAIHKEQEYWVMYTVSHGVWTGSTRDRRFIPNGFIENKGIKVTARDFNSAKQKAFKELSEHRTLNEFIRVQKAILVPPKKEDKEEVV